MKPPGPRFCSPLAASSWALTAALFPRRSAISCSKISSLSVSATGIAATRPEDSFAFPRRSLFELARKMGERTKLAVSSCSQGRRPLSCIAGEDPGVRSSERKNPFFFSKPPPPARAGTPPTGVCTKAASALRPPSESGAGDPMERRARVEDTSSIDPPLYSIFPADPLEEQLVPGLDVMEPMSPPSSSSADDDSSSRASSCSDHSPPCRCSPIRTRWDGALG
eukprot:CAMPEP_0180118308 /NCGR_PEP_ID=MMETSP0986-20121125/1388_1 /TAXON_ID=697907 /ORGANISM="non described non described, Strain CCMP2293" /LENGTH=222 /DNA_ID=CAMNT_0022057251 /DNA_START=673 /DNA_END=1337 /DNA_ORIENTATION=+